MSIYAFAQWQVMKQLLVPLLRHIEAVMQV